jgi:hypothetical protein
VRQPDAGLELRRCGGERCGGREQRAVVGLRVCDCCGARAGQPGLQRGCARGPRVCERGRHDGRDGVRGVSMVVVEQRCLQGGRGRRGRGQARASGHGQGQGRLPVVVSAGLQCGSLTQAWSYDAAEVSAVGAGSNGPSSGCVSVTVAGQGLGSRGYSGAARVGRGSASEGDMTGGTACEASRWLSSSCIVSKLFSGYLFSSPFRMSVVFQVSNFFRFSFDSPFVGVLNSSLLFFSGSLLVSVSGQNFAVAFGSAQSHLGQDSCFSSCPTSGWSSDSLLSIKIAPSFVRMGTLKISVQSQSGSSTNFLNYCGSFLSSVSPSLLFPMVNSGSTLLSTYGNNFGSQFAASIRLSLGNNSSSIHNSGSRLCIWISDSSIFSKKPSGSEQVISLLLSITAGSVVHWRISPFSFQLDILNIGKQNAPASGSFMLDILGTGFGSWSVSASIKLERLYPNFYISGLGTSAMQSIWFSDSSVISKIAAGAHGSQRNSRNPVFYISAGNQIMRKKHFFASESAFVQSSSNNSKHSEPTSGSRYVAIYLKHFGSQSVSLAIVRVKVSAAENSLWISDSSVQSLFSSGVGLAFYVGYGFRDSTFVVVTLLSRATSLSESFSHEAPRISFVIGQLATTGSGIVAFGTNFGRVTYSIRSTFFTSALLTSWKSDSAIVSLRAASEYCSPGSKYLTMTVAFQPTTSPHALDYAVPHSNLSLTASTFTGSSIIILCGTGMPRMDVSASSRLQQTFTEFSRWISSSSLMIKNPRSSASVRSITVTLDQGCILNQSLTPVSVVFMNSTDSTAFAASGSSYVRIFGAAFGTSLMSAAASFSISSFSSSAWRSDSTVVSKVISGHWYSSIVSMSLGMKVSSAVNSTFLFLVHQSTSLNVSCLESTGSKNVFLLGQSFDAKDSSIRSRNKGYYQSSFEISEWRSDTSIVVKQGSHFSQMLTVSLPWGSSQIDTSGSLSCSLPDVNISPVKLVSTGRTLLFIHSVHSGKSDSSPRLTVGNSAMLTTLWISDSFLSARVNSFSQWYSKGLTISIHTQTLISRDATVMSHPFVFNSSQSHAISTGGCSVSFIAATIGISDSSLRSKVGSTSVSESTWISESSIYAKLSISNQANSSFTTTTASVSAVHAEIKFRLSEASILYVSLGKRFPVSGSQVINITAIGLGVAKNSISLRLGYSSTQQSSWKSDSMVAVKVQSFAAFGSTFLLLSMGQRISPSSSNLNMSFFEVLHSSSHVSNQFLTGSSSTILTLAGFDFRSARFSNNFRISSTSGESTLWFSDSSVRIKCGRRLKNTHLISSLDGPQNLITLSMNFTIAVAFFSKVDLSTTGGDMLSVSGLLLGNNDISTRASFRYSVAPSSEWLSDSSVQIKLSASAACTMQVSVSSSQLERQLVVAEMDAGCRNVTNATVSQTSIPATGSFETILFSSKFNLHDVSLKVRLETAAASTVWRSDTACKVKSLTFKTLLTQAKISIQGRNVFYDVIPLNTFSLQPLVHFFSKSPNTGSHMIHGVIFNLGSHDVSQKISTSRTICEQSNWLSDSSVQIKLSASAACTMQVSVSSSQLERQLVVAEMDAGCRNVTNATVSQTSIPATGSFETILFSSKFNLHDVSLKVRLETAAASTVWRSDSACKVKLPNTHIHVDILISSLAHNVIATSEVLVRVNTPSVGFLMPATIPTTGSFQISLIGSNFATYSVSKTVKFQDSLLSSILHWISDSAALARTPAIRNSHPSIAFVCMQLMLNATAASPIFLKNTTHSLLPATGSISIYVIGANFAASSPASRLSSSSCQISKWIADSTVSCKSTGVSNGIHSITLSHNEASLVPTHESVTILASSIIIRSISPQVVPTTGNNIIKILASGFGDKEKSALVFLGQSLCFATEWTSDSSIRSSIVFGAGRGVSIGVASGDSTLQLSNGSTFDWSKPFMISLSSLNSPTIGIQLQVFGYAFGMSDFSVASKIGITSAVASVWFADSCISLKPAVGTQDSLTIAATVALNVGTLTNVFSYDAASLLDVSPKARGTMGGRLVLSGFNFGEPRSLDKSVFVGRTSCSEILIVSDLRIACLVNAGTGSNLTIIAIIGDRTAKLAGAFSYFAPTLSGVGSRLRDSTGSQVVTTLGLMLGFHENSPKTCISRSATTVTLWSSDSSIISLSNQGAGVHFTVHVSISHQLGSLSKCFSFSRPVVHLSSKSLAATLSVFLLMHGSYFGVFEFSSAQRLGNSATENSKWYSDSSAICKATSMNYQEISLGMSVAQNFADALIYMFSNISLSIQNISSSTSGSFKLHLMMAGAGSLCSSARALLGNSNTESTIWMSSSSIKFKSPRIHNSNTGVAISLENAVSRQSEVNAIYLRTQFDLLNSSNFGLPSTGSFGLNISGKGIGTALQSGAIRFGNSRSRNSYWLSESSIFAKTSSGSTFMSVVSTANGLVSFLALETDSFLLNKILPGSLVLESVRTGQLFLRILAASLGTHSSSLNSRVRDTAASACLWHSDSSVSSKSNGFAPWSSFVISDTRKTFKNFRANVTTVVFTLPVLTSSFSSTGSSGVLLQASNLGQFASSQRGRLDKTSSSRTFWRSDSAMFFKMPHFVPKSTQLLISVLSEIVSMTVQSSANMNITSNFILNISSTGSFLVKLAGTSFQLIGYSLSFKFQKSSCTQSRWSSDSSLVCKVSGLGTITHSFITSVCLNVASTTLTYLSPLVPKLTSVCNTHQVLATTGSEILPISGSSFFFNGGSVKSKLGSTSCCASVWQSDSSTTCKNSQGATASSTLSTSFATFASAMNFSVSYSPPIPLVSLPNRSITQSRIGNMITITGKSFGTYEIAGALSSVRFGITMARSTVYVSDSSLIATPSAGKTGLVNISLIRDTIESAANIAFEYTLDLNYGTMFLTSNVAGSITVFHFMHTFTLGLQNSSTIEFTFPNQFLFSGNSTLNCNISGNLYSVLIHEWKTAIQMLRSCAELATMKCVGSDISLVGYETSLDPIIMLVHLERLEIVFQSFEPHLTRIVASPITLSIMGSASLKAGSVVHFSTIFTFDRQFSDLSTFYIELFPSFIDSTALIEFNGTSKTLSKQQSMVSFPLLLSANPFLSISMSFENATLPGQSGEVVFMSGFIIDAHGRKTHELVQKSFFVQANDFGRTKAVCLPDCFAGESPPSRIEVVTANHLPEGSYLQVYLIGTVKMEFRQVWTTVQANFSARLINHSTFMITVESQIPKKSVISFETDSLSIQTGPSNTQQFLICSYSRSGSPIDCSASYYIVLPSRITMLFSSKTYAPGIPTSLNITLFPSNVLPSSVFCNITFNTNTVIQQAHFQSESSQVVVQSLITQNHVATLKLLFSPFPFSNDSFSLTVSNISYLKTSSICIVNLTIFSDKDSYAALDRVKLEELFEIEAKNLFQNHTNEQFFGTSISLNDTFFRIINISSTMMSHRPISPELEDLLTDSINSMSFELSRNSYIQKNYLLSFQNILTMKTSGNCLFAVFYSGSVLEIRYNFTLTEQPTLRISEQIQIFTWTSSYTSALSQQFRFWPQNILSNFEFILMTIPWNISSHPRLQNIISKRGAICQYFYSNSTPTTHVCEVHAINLNNVTCKCILFGHVVVVYNHTVDELPDIISSLSVVLHPKPKIVSMQTIYPIIVYQLDIGGYTITTIESNMSVNLLSAYSSTRNATLTTQLSYTTNLGILNISNLYVDKAGVYRLQIHMLGSTLTAETNDFEIIFGHPVSFNILRWPTHSTCCDPMTIYPMIAVADAGGNIITNEVFVVTLYVQSKLKFAMEKSSKSTEKGIASFPDFVIQQQGIHNVSISVGLHSFTLFKILTVLSGTAAILIHQVSQFEILDLGGAPFQMQPVLTFLDIANNTAVSTEGVVSCFILISQGNTSTASLLGNTSIAAISGVVRFTDLAIDKTGSYTLKFLATNNLSVESGSILIETGPGYAMRLDQRPLDVTGGRKFPSNVTVSVIDRGTNVVISNETFVTAHLFQGGQARALGGTSTVQTLRGKAVFTNLFVNMSGVGYFIQFTAFDLVTVFSPTFSVTIGPAFTLRLLSAPNTSFGGLPFDESVVVYAEDEGGNKLNTGIANIDVNQSSVELDVSLLKFTGSGFVAITAGIAEFKNLTLYTAGRYSLMVGIDAKFLFFNIFVTASSPVRIFAPSIPKRFIAGEYFNPSFAVEIVDVAENVNTLYFQTVAANISLISVSLTFEASYFSSCSYGICVFSEIVITKVGNYSISFSAPNLMPYFVIISVSSGRPSIMQFLQYPVPNSAGKIFLKQPVLLILDKVLNNITVLNSSITIICTAFAAATEKYVPILGDVSIKTSIHVVEFQRLQINVPQMNVTLLFSVIEYPDIQALACNVSVLAGPAVRMEYRNVNSINTGGAPFQMQPVLTFLDIANNTAVSTEGVVSCFILISQGNTSTASLLGNTSIAAISGVVRFTDLAIDKTGSYTLKFLATNNLSVESGSILIETGPGYAMRLDQRPLDVTGGRKFPSNVTVSVIDRGTNVVISNETFVTAHLFQGGQARALGGTSTVQTLRGKAVFTNLFVNMSGVGYFIQFTAFDLVTVFSPTFSVTIGPAFTLRLLSAPNTSFGGLPFDESVVVYAEDEGGNKLNTGIANIDVNQSSVELDVSLLKFTGSGFVAITAGIAEFKNLTLYTAGRYSLMVGIDDQRIFVFINVSSSFLYSLDFIDLGSIQIAGAYFSFCIEATDKGYNKLIGVRVSVLTYSVVLQSAIAAEDSPSQTQSTNAFGKACFEKFQSTIYGNHVLMAKSAPSNHLSIERNASFFVDSAPLQSLVLINPIQYASINEIVQPAPLKVRLQDVFGNTLRSFVGEVIVSLQGFHDAVSPTENAYLSETVISRIQIIDGVASFNISINSSGVYALLFACNDVNMSSSRITVVQDGITSLQTITNPENSTAGLNLNHQPVLVILDKYSRIHAGVFQLTASLVSVIGTGVLFGNTTTLYSNGSASFSDLKVDKVGTYQLRFQFGTFDAITPAFCILPGAPSKMSLLSQPPKHLASSVGFTVVVKIMDFVGNVVPTAQLVNVSSRTSVVIGSVSIISTDGIAIFNELKIFKTGTTTLIFTSEHVTMVESDLFEVINGKLQMILSEEVLDSVPCGIQWLLQPLVSISDIGGNTILRSTNISAKVHSFVNMLLFNVSKNVIYSEVIQTNTGIARFFNVRSTFLGKNILSFNAEGMYNISNVFIVTIGPAHSISILQQPSSGTVGQSLFTQPRLRIVDFCNNSVLAPILIQVEFVCHSFNRTILLQHLIFNVSEIQFVDISSNVACRQNFLSFTCVACGLNHSNISSRSVFFEVQAGALERLAFSENPGVRIIAGNKVVLPPVRFLDVGFNEVLAGGYILNITVTFQKETFFAASLEGFMGTARLPQFQLNISGEYSFTILSTNTNTLITSVVVLPGHLTKMRFASIPSDAVSEFPIHIIQIFLLDMFGNLLDETSQSVTLHLIDRPFNFIAGNLVVVSVNGTATFRDTRIGNARVDHRLVATCSNVSSVSDMFEVKSGKLFSLRVAETASSVALSQYTSNGFLQSETFKIRVEALDHFGNFIPDVNVTMSSHAVEQISAIGLKWAITSRNGSAVFLLSLSDEQSYLYQDFSFVPRFVFSSENVSVVSNSITALARLNCMLTLKEQYVEIKFNSQLDAQSLRITSCDGVFSVKTLSMFGREPFCFFSSSVEFRIRYGSDVSIMPFDTVTFNSQFNIKSIHSIWLAFEHNFEYILKVPSNIPDIVPIVRGSQAFGLCTPLILDGSASFNSFGRSFTYISWNLSIERSKIIGSFSNASQFQIKTEMLKNIDKNNGLNLMIQEWKSLNGSYFDVPAGTYVIMLTLGRWIDKQKTTTDIVLSVDAVASPTMLLTGPATVSASSAVVFRSTIFRCSNQQPVVYLWSILPVISSAIPVKLDGRAFTIPALSLVPGLAYSVLCTATIQSLTITSSANFTTDLRAPNVFVEGGTSRTIPFDEDLVLDGSRSVDADSPLSTLSFRWLCTASTGSCPNATTGLSVAVIRYLPNSFSSSQVVIFDLTATTTKGLSASSQITITFVATNVPRISIDRIVGKIDVSNVVKLQATSEKIIPSTWSILWIDVYQYNTIREDNLIGGSQKLALIFKSNVLPRGRSLKYRIQASGPNSEVVFAEVEVSTNSPPSIGSLLISKVGDTSCIVASMFNAVAQNFIDLDTPLTYTFSYKTQRSIVFFAISEGSTTLLLPCGLPVNVFVSVADSYGASCEINTTVIATLGTAPVLTLEGVSNAFMSFLSRKPDPDEVAAAAGAALSSLPTSPGFNTGALKDTILSTLSSSITNPTALSPSVLNAVVGALSMLSDNGSELSSSASSQILSTLDNVLGTKALPKDPKFLVALSKNSATVLSSLFDSPMSGTNNQRRLLSAAKSSADMLISAIERTCFILGSSLVAGQGQASLLTTKLNIFASNVPIVSQQDFTAQLAVQFLRNASTNATITIYSNNSVKSAIFYAVTMSKNIFNLDYDIAGLPVVLGVLRSDLGGKLDSPKQLSRVFLTKVGSPVDAMGTYRTICARKDVGPSEWSGIGCKQDSDSDTLIECSCQDLGVVIAVRLPLDCEGLPYGRIEGYKLNPSVCRDEVSSPVWLEGSLWGLVAVIVGVCAACSIGILYWRKTKRQELLKPLEMSSDTISDLLWNPTNSAGLRSMSAHNSEQMHALSAPKVPQPAHLQAIRSRKAKQIQTSQLASSPPFLQEGFQAQQRLTAGEQLHLSFSDSDSDSSEDFADQVSTGFDSEYRSTTNTAHSSSAAEPDFQGAKGSSHIVQAIRSRKAKQIQTSQLASSPPFLQEGFQAQQRLTAGEQLHLSFSDSDSDSPEDFADQVSTGFDSEYGSTTYTAHSSSATEPEFQDGMRF